MLYDCELIVCQAISGLLGTAGGVNGTGITGPTQANIAAPVTTQQVNQANAGVNTALGGAQGLLAALQGASGASNQGSQYTQGQQLQSSLAANNGVGTLGTAGTQQANLNNGLASDNGALSIGYGLNDQNLLAGQLGGAGGIGAQTGAISGLQGVAGQQQNTANQLQGIANGTGPNPAQAMLNQQTGQNVANQAALMAGQRGAGSNVGLIARQAAQQGAATQQQAVGQGATMQAQQSLGALGQLTGQQQAQAGTQAQIGALGQGLTGAQQAAISQQAAQGQAAVGLQQQGIAQQFGQGATTTQLQQAQQAQNAGIAQNQVTNALSGQNQVLQGNIANAGQQLGALGNYNATTAGMQGNINSANAGLANTNMQGQQAIIGGTLQGIGAGASSMGGLSGGARGGIVRRMADGGEMTPYAAPSGEGPTLDEQPGAPAVPGAAGTGMGGGVGPLANAAGAPAPMGPQSMLGQYLAGNIDTNQYTQGAASGSADQNIQSSIANTPDPIAPGMGYGSQQLWKGAYQSAKTGTEAAMAASRGGLAHQGGKVDAKSPKEKAVKPGNSYSNDKVPALLSEGEVVIPRSVMQSKDPVRGAADFVNKVMAKRRAS